MYGDCPRVKWFSIQLLANRLGDCPRLETIAQRGLLSGDCPRLEIHVLANHLRLYLAGTVPGESVFESLANHQGTVPWQRFSTGNVFPVKVELGQIGIGAKCTGCLLGMPGLV